MFNWKRGAWVVVMLGMALGVAWARKYPLTAAESISAARGDVDVDHDKNGNTKLHLKVNFLTPPDRLTPPATAYIVWIRERHEGAMLQPQGQLRVDKNRKADFETVTPAKDFDLIVTAEQDPLIKSPVGPEVLNATIQP